MRLRIMYFDSQLCTSMLVLVHYCVNFSSRNTRLLDTVQHRPTVLLTDATRNAGVHNAGVPSRPMQ